MTEDVMAGVRVGGAVGPGDIDSGAQFAAALTALRLAAGRSIRDVARATRIPSATLGGYFSGRHLPPTTQPQQFEVLLAELGVRDPDEVTLWRAALLRARQVGPARVAGQPGSPIGGGALCPYRGLEPFTDRDSALFFGRDRVVDNLVAEVETRAAGTTGPRVVIVVGSSGSGKSSVLRAGLVPRLRDRAEDPWAVSVMVPGTDPVAALAHAQAELGSAARGLVVVDQAEEVFSPLVPSDQRRAFLGQLADLAAGGGPDGGSVVVVAGLRADFYGQALADPDLLPAMRSAQVLLGSMQLEDLRRAVVEPARAVGVSVDPGLVEVLLRDLRPRGQAAPGYDAGALPLVSHALLSTWAHHSGDRLTVADYEAAGGIAGAVQQTAESVVAGLDGPGRAAAQWLFGQLVLVDDDGVMTRRRVSHDDLRHPDPVTDIALDSVIEAFVAGRLLTAGDTTLEISHEALLSAWPRLRDWLLTDLDAARLQRRIADAAAVWRERDRDPAALLRGGLLADARSLAAQPVTSHRTLAAAEQEFVAASAVQEQAEQAAARRQTTRLRSLVAVLTVLALLAGTLAGVAVRSGRQATQARDDALSRQLAITADGLRATDPALAAQVALAAYQASPTVQARSSLLDSTGVPTPTRFVGPAGEMRAVASPDGGLLALSGSDGVTRLWQAVPDGQSAPPDALGGYRLVGELPPVDGPVSVYGSAFHPDGQVLAVGTADGEVILWDLASLAAPRQVAVLDAGQVAVYSLAFSGDGRQLAAGTSEPAVLRWSVPPGGTAEPTELPKIAGEFGGNVQAVDFHPTSDLLATGSSDGVMRLWRAPADGPAALAGQASVGEPTNFVHAVAFSPNGDLLASGEKDRAARIWDVSDPAAPVQQGALLGGFGGWVNAVGFSPDGSTLVAGSSDNTVRLFAVADGQPQGVWPTPAVVTATQFVGSGAALLTGEVDGVARLWPVPGPVLGGFADTVWNIVPSADGALTAVAPGSGDGSVHLLDTTDPADPRTVEVLTPPAEAGSPDGAAGMSADGRWVAAGTSVGTVVVWERDPAAGAARLAGVVTVSDQLVEAAVISPDGTLMAAIADDGAVGVWSLQPGAPPQPAHELSVPGLPLGAAFSPDSALLAVATTGAQVHLWRLGGDPTGASGVAEELPVLTGFDNYVYSVAFDPSGRYLAAGSTDRTVRLWDVTDPGAAEPVGAELRGPRDTVYALDWSTNGALLAGASKEGSVWLWDMADPAAPTVQATLAAADGSMYAMALAPDGARVSAAGSPRTVATWQIGVDQVAADTCARTGTPMTEAEWQQLVPDVPFTPPCPT